MSTFSFNLESIEEVSDHSDTDDDIYGFNLETRYCGNMIDYDIFYYNYEHNIPMTDTEFYNYVSACVRERYNGFRNIVFEIIANNKAKYISITLDKIRHFMETRNLGFYQSLRYIIDKILECNYKEIYEHYDDSIISNDDTKCYSISNYILSNKYFAIAHVRSPAGSGIIKYSTLTHINIIEPPSIYGPGNCLFDCLSYSLDVNFNNITHLRTKLRYKDARPIKLKHLDIIAKNIGYNIRVYEDRFINGTLVYYITKNTSDKLISLVLNNKHYSIYDGNREHIPSNTVAESKCIIFYDMETYFNKITHIVEPYCLSYYISEPSGDTYGCIIKSSYNDNIGDHIYSLFKKYIDTGARLVGYNNGAFDDYILLNILCRRLDKLDNIIIDRRNHILSFRLGNISSRDLYKIICTSLHKASTSFKCKYTKLNNIDHHMIQSHVDNGTFDQYITTNIETIRQYAMMDVLCLRELYDKAISTFTKICNIKADTCLTIAQLSIRSYKSYIKSIAIRLPILHPDDDNLVRQALIGGRCDVFNTGEYHNIQMIDVCSMYPYVMSVNIYPHASSHDTTYKYIVPRLTRTTRYLNNVPGIYYVTILKQPHDNIVPSSNTTNGKYNWHSDNHVTRWISNITLSMLITYSCKYIIQDGYILQCEQDYIFRDYLSPMLNLKKQQDIYKTTNSNDYNPTLRECLKLLMNALSGKTCEKPIDIVKILTNNTSKCNEMIYKYYDNISCTLIHDNLWLLEGKIDEPKIKSPVIIGMMILDYAKKYMYDNILSKISNKYYMDTDSVILHSSDISNIPSNLFGNNEGNIKHVLPPTDGPYHAIIAAKKCYCIYTIINGTETIYKDMFKIRGINSNTDKYIHPSILDQIQSYISTNNHIILNKIYTEAPTIKSIQLMRDLANNSIINILCYQIDRSNNITSRYLLKSLPYNLDDAI